MGKAERKREKSRSRKSTKKSGKKQLSVAATMNVTQSVLSSVSQSSEMAIMHRSNPNPRKIGLYSNRQRILLVGEGDFSFAAALATALGGERVVATSLDSLPKLLEKYPTTASTTLSTLRRLGARIAHRVDALDLSGTLPDELHETGFDRVVFNFPHVGGATAEDVAANQKVVREFARSACGLLRPGPTVANSRQTPQVHVTLRATPFYQSWNVGRVAEETGEVKLVKTVPFDAEAFQALGYAEVRTNPAARDAPSTIAAETYVWEATRMVRVKAARKSPSSITGSTGSTKRPKIAVPHYDSNGSISRVDIKVPVVQENNVKPGVAAKAKATFESNEHDDTSVSGIRHSTMKIQSVARRTSMKKVTKGDDVRDMNDADKSKPSNALEARSGRSDVVKRALEKKLRQIDSLKTRPLSSLNEGQKAKLSREPVLRAELEALVS
jgi:25S rRNA (uracil2634-N3)-methyltransferase